MSPNSDNAMARFLFAILKQKNLKDIDWNLVAADPVLLQPISNGHAARMRYSRFRATVSENRPSSKSKGDKTRISKSKGKGGPIKCGADGSPMIKQEYTGQGSLSHYSPASTTSPYLSDNQDFSARFLTPCSDDMASVMAVNPAAVERQPHATYSPSLDFMNPSTGLQSPHHDFSAFDEATFDMSAFTHDTQTAPLDDWNDRLHNHF